MKTGIARPALLIAAATLAAGSVAAAHGTASAIPRSHGSTSTPIKHVIVIIGENHSFDNVFATYTPPRHQQIENLLSEGIVTADGTPGPNFAKAEQLTASDTGTYTLTPKVTGTYQTLPQPNTTYVHRLRRPRGRQPGHPVPGGPAGRAVPDHQVRAVRRQPFRVHRGLRVPWRVPRRPAAPLLPDVAAVGRQP
ncbi:MAG TPA: hypothetical protein VKU39_07900 [Streptosporangiaceae bacterium]|nr:hypothetical protein [Streptosporangiaceae bacterium]